MEDSTYMPSDFAGSGPAVVEEENRLVPEDIWLGISQFGKGGTNCGHIFTRQPP